MIIMHTCPIKETGCYIKYQILYATQLLLLCNIAYSVFEESLQNGETITCTPFTEPRFLVGCWFVTIFPLMTLKTNNNCLEKSQKLYI